MVADANCIIVPDPKYVVVKLGATFCCMRNSLKESNVNGGHGEAVNVTVSSCGQDKHSAQITATPQQHGISVVLSSGCRGRGLAVQSPALGTSFFHFLV